GRDGTGRARRRSSPGRTSTAARRADAACDRRGEGLPVRSCQARVDLPRALVRRARPPAALRRLCVSTTAQRAAMKKILTVALVALVLASTAAALDTHRFRYERTLTLPGPGPVRLEPDGPLYSPSRAGFADLRILDAAGRQVPWRTLPVEEGAAPVAARVLNAGRQDGRAVALLDFGSTRRVR